MSSTHNEIVRESFTTQATAFAANPGVSDEQRIARLVSTARLTGKERVLDTATGPVTSRRPLQGARAKLWEWI